MKRRMILFTILNLMVLVIFSVFTYQCTSNQEQMVLNVYFGESHAGKNNIAQVFYSDNVKRFKSNKVITHTFADDVASVPIGEIDFKENYLRIDPFNQKEDFSILKLEVACGNEVLFSIQGKDMKSYIKSTKKISCEWQDDALVCQSQKADPKIIMKKSFSESIQKNSFLKNDVPCIVVLLLYCILGLIEICCLIGSDLKKRYLILESVTSTILLAVGIVAVYVFQYFEEHFGQVPFGQLLYHLHTPLDGTDISSYVDVIVFGIALTLILVFIHNVINRLLKKKQANRGYLLWCGFLGMMLVVFAGVQTILHFDIVEYYQYVNTDTTLYEDYYVDGRDVKLTFPETKRNLIYIFLESMETTYADTTSGGAMQQNYMPELTKLALENNCFTEGSVLNGAYHVNGATYTMGALAAQTSGVPINTELVSTEALNSTWDSENNYLPGVWSIGDVLAEQGYNQELLIGSVGDFAGRSSYFRGHGNYAIEDYNAAIEKNRIPSDYKVWWGYEDKKLFDFAKEDIAKLAEQDEPFNFTMLTVDTHFTDGYECDLCEDDYGTQYSNVIACSSKQVAEFVNWIKEQDFYENTTIVIAGDHLTMDSAYINNEGVAGFDRKMYFSIVNPADGKVNKNGKRTYTSLDLYPTTLSSLGVDIEGNRLGLGVDIYSDTPTIIEEKGLDYLNTELMKNSEYYTKKLLYK